MTNTMTILAIIERVAAKVDALESLAACMSQGMSAGVLDAGHLYTILSTQTGAIRATLGELAREVEHVHAANDG